MIEEKHHISYDDLDKEYEMHYSVFSNGYHNLADQAAVLQSKTISNILEPAEIKHISIDAIEVMKNFYVKCFEDKETDIYDIFNDKEKREKLVSDLSNVRAGWEKGCSPFSHVKRNERNVRINKIGCSEFSHDPKILVDLMNKGAIIPSTGLVMIGSMMSGGLSHGGFFQSNYSRDMQKKLVTYLDQIGKKEKT